MTDSLEKYLKLNEQLDSKSEQILAAADSYLQHEVSIHDQQDHIPKLAEDFDELEKKIEKSVKINDAKEKSIKKPALTPKSQAMVDHRLPETVKLLPAANQNRLLQARINVLDTELQKQLEKNAKVNAMYLTTSEKLKQLEVSSLAHERQLTSLKIQNEKFKQTIEDQKTKMISLQNEKINSDKELTKIMREDKQKSSKVAQYETRLNRAVEEMEKMKSELQKTKKNQRDDLIKDGARNQDLLQENRHLARQVDDLKNCVKKQFKLIDVLKSQKMHLEAARSLQFTESEWRKIMESNIDESKSFF